MFLKNFAVESIFNFKFSFDPGKQLISLQAFVFVWMHITAFTSMEGVYVLTE